jgi:Tol biopolymer transport system component
MLTETQKNNIAKMSFDDLIELSNICDEMLGTSLPSDFIKILAYDKKRETLFNNLKSGNIKSKQIGNKRFPYLNVYIAELQKNV